MAQDVDDVDALSVAIAVLGELGQRIKKLEMSIRTVDETRQNNGMHADPQALPFFGVGSR